MAQRASGNGQAAETKEIMTERELQRAGLAPEVLPAGDNLPAMDSPDYDSELLQNAETWEDVLAILETANVEIDIASKVLGDGFVVLSTDDKASLVGKKMVLIDWRFNKGMGMFVSVRAMVQMAPGAPIRRVIINDGSTGIMKTILTYTEKNAGKRKALLVEKGLRLSEYTYTDDKGNERPARTYYLDASPDDVQ